MLILFISIILQQNYEQNKCKKSFKRVNFAAGILTKIELISGMAVFEWLWVIQIELFANILVSCTMMSKLLIQYHII